MLNPLDSIRNLTAQVDPAIVERHLRRMPSVISSAMPWRRSPGTCGCWPQFLSPIPLLWKPDRWAGWSMKLTVCCENYSGSVACITTALAADRFDLEDVQIASYDEQRRIGRRAEPVGDPVARLRAGRRPRRPPDLAAALQ